MLFQVLTQMFIDSSEYYIQQQECTFLMDDGLNQNIAITLCQCLYSDYVKLCMTPFTKPPLFVGIGSPAAAILLLKVM